MTLISFVGVGWQELWDNSAALLAPTEMQQDIFRDPCSRAPRSNAMYRSKSCIHKRSRHLSQAIPRGFEQQRLTHLVDVAEKLFLCFQKLEKITQICEGCHIRCPFCGVADYEIARSAEICRCHRASTADGSRRVKAIPVVTSA